MIVKEFVLSCDLKFFLLPNFSHGFARQPFGLMECFWPGPLTCTSVGTLRMRSAALTIESAWASRNCKTRAPISQLVCPPSIQEEGESNGGGTGGSYSSIIINKTILGYPDSSQASHHERITPNWRNRSRTLSVETSFTRPPRYSR